MRIITTLALLLTISAIYSQEASLSIISLEEYIAMIKKHHPIVKQANLITTTSETKLLKARGKFDPKITLENNQKNFKDKEYYNTLNAYFKIPTWYGIELKGGYENNSGEYLNPQNTVPENGLYTAGITIPLAKNLLINQRRATLKQAKLYNNQAKEEQKLKINDIIFNSLEAYFNWLKAYQTKKMYATYLENAELRLQNIKTSFLAGDKPEIDTLEANINLKNRLLELESAKITYTKSSLELANYLWTHNNIPLETNNFIKPDTLTYTKIDNVLASSLKVSNSEIENHPKIKALEYKRESLKVEKRLQLNNLLPTVNYQHNLLTTKPTSFDSFSSSNFKNNLLISTPLFLRKERANLKIAKLKLQDIDYDILFTKTALTNKINNLNYEITSYKTQNDISKELVNNYKKLTKSEERKFSLGEGSLFLVNYREAKLIEVQIKNISTQYKYLISKAKLNQAIATF